MSDEDFTELEGFRVEVERVVHVPHLETPPEKPHPFVYFINIINESAETLTVAGRKWVLREENGEVMVLEGEGVVGERPRLSPGRIFSYNSYHVLASSSAATGSFFGHTDKGARVRATIPEFRMRVPELD